MQSAQTIRQLARIEKGIPLWGCLPDSPSAQAGLRYGDIILRIDALPDGSERQRTPYHRWSIPPGHDLVANKTSGSMIEKQSPSLRY